MTTSIFGRNSLLKAYFESSQEHPCVHHNAEGYEQMFSYCISLEDLNVGRYEHEDYISTTSQKKKDYISTHENAASLVCNEREIYIHFHSLLGHLVHEL